MNMRLTVFFMLLIYSCLSFGVNSTGKESIELKSPDSKVQIEVSITDKITYSVNYGSETILMPSAISMKLQNGIILGGNPKFRNSRNLSINHKIYPDIRQKRKEQTRERLSSRYP